MINLFWPAAAAIAWNLAGYPFLLKALARFTGRPHLLRTRAIGKVSVIVAAHDEESCIGERVGNILRNGSWRPVEVIVVSDGSTDGTVARARGAGATVIEQERAGKIAALDRGVAAASGDALVITDANTRFAPGAIDALVAPLEDESTGIAAGDLVFENEGEAESAAGEGAYWRYETWIKRNASDAGFLLMGAGGIYAVRREDWPSGIPPALADDSYVPLSLHRSGRRNVFVEEAKAFERAGTSMQEEWRRRVRMVAQDIRVATALDFGLPNSRTCFALVSHKVLRWALMPLGLVLLGSSPAAARSLRSRGGAPLRLLAFGIGALPVMAGLVLGAGAVALTTGRRLPLVSRIFYFAGATTAAAYGAALGLCGRSRASWEKAASTRGVFS